MTPVAASGVACPCCGGRYREFAPYGQDQNVECPGCGAHERHRLLWFYLTRQRPDVFSDDLSVLHFAPEECIAEKLRTLPNLRYVSADLKSSAAMVHFDITRIPYDDRTFDLILCSHVLEHVHDDGRAMRELARVLRPGGSAIVLVPTDQGRASTFEDPALASDQLRERAYGQADHLRLYGRDFRARLEEAGLEVTVDRYVRGLDPALVARYGMRSTGMFVCARSGDGT